MAAETEGFCHASETQSPGGLLPAPVLCRRGRLFRRLRHPGPMRRAGQRPDHEPAGDGHGCPPRKGRQRPAAPAVPGDLFSGHHVHGAAAAPVPCGYAAALPGGGRPGGGGRGRISPWCGRRPPKRPCPRPGYGSRRPRARRPRKCRRPWTWWPRSASPRPDEYKKACVFTPNTQAFFSSYLSAGRWCCRRTGAWFSGFPRSARRPRTPGGQTPPRTSAWPRCAPPTAG